MRKTTIFLLMVLVLSSVAFAQAITEVPEDAYRGYKSLDPASSEKIYFDGYTVKWGGKTFSLDENTFFLDSRLEDSYVETNPYVFNDALKALEAVNSGTADKPMMLLVAPGVYWVDDPDSDVIRTATNGPSKSGTPVGAVVTCDYLWFYGLNSNPYNVVFAVNRGQQAGAEGNFTMFAISGVGLRSDNVTFGNYCNVDLVYDLDPSLSRAKRSDAITQAQLFSYGGGDGIAVNTNFISRLNLSQFAKYFYNCHLESGGHAGGGYYVNCDFLLCNANFGGANMFNCDVTFDSYDHLWKGKTEFDFNLVDGKGNGLILVDTRFYRGKNLVDNNVNINLTWDNAPQTYTTRAYQYNVTLDGQPVIFQEMYTPGASVVVTDGSDLAKAFVVECNGERVYNLKNITGFDPFGGEEKIKAAAKAAGLAEDAYFSIPTKINVALDVDTIQSGSDVATLTYAFASYPETEGTWSFAVKDPALASYVSLKDNGDGTVTVEGTNSTEDACKVLIEATHSLGLKAAVELVATPSFIEAPAFTQAPSLSDYENGSVTLNYALDLGHKDRVDQSVI
ncbi:MAG: hypothetical protein HUK23_03885, partial [Sphaerochaetaceae bacterium]|nr:hypothetical protein [Sphaerochaetaceae bacterium]